jgi:hypothetical protein
MSKYLKTVTIFLLPIVLLCICAEVLLRNIPNVYSYKKQYLDKNSNKVNVLFLGTSHVFFGIDPAYMKSDCFNAANLLQTFNYDLAILKKYANNWQRLKYIVVPVDYLSFYTTLENSIEPWRVKNYNIYYGIYTTNNIKYYTEIFSNEPKYNFSRIYDFYIAHKNSVECSELGWGTSYNSQKKQDLLISGKDQAEKFKLDNEYFDQNLTTLKSIIEFAQERNAKVILVTSPAYKTYTQNLHRKPLMKTINTATDLAKTYSNVSYYNLLADKDFTAEDFYDADHVNEIGAKKFTNKIDSLMRLTETEFQQQRLSYKKSE